MLDELWRSMPPILCLRWSYGELQHACTPGKNRMLENHRIWSTSTGIMKSMSPYLYTGRHRLHYVCNGYRRHVWCILFGSSKRRKLAYGFFFANCVGAELRARFSKKKLTRDRKVMNVNKNNNYNHKLWNYRYRPIVCLCGTSFFHYLPELANAPFVFVSVYVLLKQS